MLLSVRWHWQVGRLQRGTRCHCRCLANVPERASTRSHAVSNDVPHHARGQSNRTSLETVGRGEYTWKFGRQCTTTQLRASGNVVVPQVRQVCSARTPCWHAVLQHLLAALLRVNDPTLRIHRRGTKVVLHGVCSGVAVLTTTPFPLTVLVCNPHASPARLDHPGL